jgi:hypothetical protein
VSSAILLAAIVAIWACALVPRWVRRAHEAQAEPRADQWQAEDGVPETDPGYWTPEAEDEYADEIAYEAEAAYQARAMGQPEDGAGRPVHAGPAQLAVLPAGPADGRSRVLQARRRTLTMLVLLCAAAVGARVLGLAHSWIVIPPAGMLAMYLLLLRVAAHADAENAARRAAAHSRAAARARAAALRSARAAAAARERAREAAEAAAPEQTAEVIDIAARAAQSEDQLYDQYADATARAIGD